jgi:hypothetical protein
MKMLKSRADITIGGGAAGASKTFSMLMRRTRHMHIKNFYSLILRRTTPQIRNPGGLWDAAEQIYPLLGAKPNKSMLTHTWPSGASSKFSHLQHEKNLEDYQGTEIPAIGFDELTHFTKKMFFYMLSRNRSTCGVKPYMDAGCNPDPDSFVADLIDWWIGEDGFPIAERSGVLRYFTQISGNYVWGDTAREVYDQAKAHIDNSLEKAKGRVTAKDLIKSITFIHGSVYDNIELLDKNPEYLGNLLSLPKDEQRMLLDGNWKIRLDGTEIYRHKKFEQMFNNTHIIPIGDAFITADIAMKGADCFVVKVWKRGFVKGSDTGLYTPDGQLIPSTCEPTGKVLVDIDIMEKSDGADIITLINKFAATYGVEPENIAYDSDGVGQFVDGFIPGAYSFVNNARAYNEENYNSLKDQVYFKSADAVNFGLYHVLPDVANREFNIKSRKKGALTVKKILFSEMRVMKRDKVNHDGKLRIEGKDKQKENLGFSPDFMDAFAMVEVWDCMPYVGIEETEHDHWMV